MAFVFCSHSINILAPRKISYLVNMNISNNLAHINGDIHTFGGEEYCEMNIKNDIYSKKNVHVNSNSN